MVADDGVPRYRLLLCVRESAQDTRLGELGVLVAVIAGSALCEAGAGGEQRGDTMRPAVSQRMRLCG
jgi:hypothetical protein